MKSYVALFDADHSFIYSRHNETLEDFYKRLELCFSDMFYTVIECKPVYPKH